jgi:hypothetical protein
MSTDVAASQLREFNSLASGAQAVAWSKVGESKNDFGFGFDGLL